MGPEANEGQGEKVEEGEAEVIGVIEETEVEEGREEKGVKEEIEETEATEVIEVIEKMAKRRNTLTKKQANNHKQRNYSNKGSPSKKIVIVY